MSSPPPPVSIGLPVYNGADYLAVALDSLLAQTFPDFELLISDNASTDATEEICRAVAAADPRVRYERLPQNLGAAANYNRLVHLARGRWFRWASHDDLLDEAAIGLLHDHMQAHPAAVLAYPKSTLIDEAGETIADHEDNLDLRQPQPWQRIAKLARRWSKCHPIFGLIDRERLLGTNLIGPYVGSDVTLLAELALVGEFHELPQRMFHRRIHAASSRQGELTLDEVANWFDPSNTRAPRLTPSNLVMLKILESLRTSDLPVGQRVLCGFAYCGVWEYRKARMRGGELKQRVLATRRAAVPG